jgi:phenylacetate-CoA ligase
MISLARLGNSLTMLAGRRSPERLLGFVRHLPMPIVGMLRSAGFRQTVRLAGRRSRFYREKFAALGIKPDRVRNLADLKDCYTTTEELRAAQPEDLLCGKPELVFESSGTTGRITRLYLSYGELDYAARQGIVFLAMVGIGPQDRILGTFGYWASLYTERMIAKSGLFGIVPGLVDPREAVEWLKIHRFTVIIADPFWLSRLTEVAMARGIRVPMKAFISGAERLTDHLRDLIENYWGVPLYMAYASTELGASLGAECRAKAGYHLNEYDYAVEVVDPDAEGYGEIVFTTLTRGVMPLIRYRTGDIARLIPEPCACGLPFRRLSAIRGRSDEVIACVWGDVHPDLFADLLYGAPGVGDEWQVALCQRDLRPVFEFRVETEGGELTQGAIERHIRHRLAEHFPPLWTKTQQQMCDIAVRFVAPGVLRTGRKLRRLVDERDGPSPAT